MLCVGLSLYSSCTCCVTLITPILITLIILIHCVLLLVHCVCYSTSELSSCAGVMRCERSKSLWEGVGKATHAPCTIHIRTTHTHTAHTSTPHTHLCKSARAFPSHAVLWGRPGLELFLVAFCTLTTESVSAFASATMIRTPFLLANLCIGRAISPLQNNTAKTYFHASSSFVMNPHPYSNTFHTLVRLPWTHRCMNVPAPSTETVVWKSACVAVDSMSFDGSATLNPL